MLTYVINPVLCIHCLNSKQCVWICSPPVLLDMDKYNKQILSLCDARSAVSEFFSAKNALEISISE